MQQEQDSPIGRPAFREWAADCGDGKEGSTSVTDESTSTIDLRSLKAEARRRARIHDGPSYCQALDALARDAGHPHWKALTASVAAERGAPGGSEPSGMEASTEALRRASEKLNAWISRGLNTDPDPIALRSALTDRDLTFHERTIAVARSMGPLRGTAAPTRDAATLLATAIVHDALVDGDLSLMPWRRAARDLVGDDVLHAVEGMWSAGPPARHDDPQGDEACIARIELSTSMWFSKMAQRASTKDRDDLALMLSDLAAGDHSRRVAVLDAIRPLRLLMERDRAAFETMLAERYAARTSGRVEDHHEDARSTLDAHLEDEGIAFGDASIVWDRDHANELADVDLEHWEP